MKIKKSQYEWYENCNKNIHLNKEDLNFLLKWIQSKRHKFKKNIISDNREYLFLNKEPSTPKLFFDIKKQILNKENILNNYIEDNILGDYIGYITNGGKIHRHIDLTIPGYDHIRFNLFLSIPEKGGFPIYNEISIPVKVGDYVRCNASKEYHECEMVEGEIPRIIVSYKIYLKKILVAYE